MNHSFKRFRLVEDDEFRNIDKQKLVRDYNPELSSEVRKRVSVKDILSDERLTPELKLLFYRQLNHNLKSVTETVKPKAVPKDVTIGFQHEGYQTELPIHMNQEEDEFRDPEAEIEIDRGEEEEVHLDPPVVDHEAELGIETIDMSEIVSKLPNQAQEKAQLLAEILNKRPDMIKLTKTYQIIMENELIENSNAIDLFKFLYNPGNRDDVPIGYVKFKRILASLKVPANIIGNKHLKADLQDAYQTGFGKRFHQAIAYAKRSIIPKSSKSIHIDSKFIKSKPLKRALPITSISNLKLYKF